MASSTGCRTVDIGRNKTV